MRVFIFPAVLALAVSIGAYVWGGLPALFLLVL